MTDERSGPGPRSRGEARRSRDEEAHRLHRWEASAAADRRGGDIRRHTNVSTSAALDIPTRPDPAAPLSSVAQSGATGRATTSGPGRARRRRRRGLSTKLLGAAGVLGMLLTWELLPLTGLVNERFMPPASQAIGGLITNFGLTDFWVAVADTMWAWALGMIIAVVLATVLGFVIGSSTFLRRFTNSTIEFLRPVPSVALIPLAVLLFGVGIESSLMLIVYACFWQVLIQVLYGVADVDAVAMNTARSYGLGPFARMRYVTFPTALPYVMTGVRLAAAVALILAITAQLIIGTPGLGAEISRAQSGGNYVSMYALVLATGLLGVLINLVMRIIERKILSWHSSVRTEVAA
ncbi:ABC-type nitrate/sulfonate/bicarbonate transport system permease component [Nesterenkonia lutea]|uniref:ABC-type nitrate/sulfonate/bicarbonate transport system permease component n=2 Tax=Nesterenkonia lutea TaxID=272919 RepID=A0ABR9JBG5_9MICC|nr:ABC transporter permease [Nesterenkonia lutea]MBE1523277.1 ABC-type nitrate/sulfonate/bicarbonate transport system permease component [Nesterenkonia lutea]